MKAQIISDTHTFDYSIHPDADILIHAGDISNGDLSHYFHLRKMCAHANIPYVIAPGNHCSFGWDIDEFYKELDRLKINYLTDGKTFEFGGYTFVGGTLHSNFQLYSTDPVEIDRFREYAQHNIYDFISIKHNGELIQTAEYITRFNKQLNWINQFRNKDKVVGLTHFVPNPLGMDPFYGDNPRYRDLNPYFVNNIDLKGFKLWIAGHTHTAIDAEKDGCRLIINPLGYPNEQGNNGFKEHLLLELN